MMPPESGSFQCQISDVLRKINVIDPRAYDKSRNYLDGAVSWLSPFIAHGITNTQEVAEHILQSREPSACYRFLYELGWREFFHRTWQKKGNAIFDDMRAPQVAVESHQLPQAIVNATTRIDTVDQCLQALYADGLMHNHARMWVAAMVCNMARTHWKPAAKFLHYHLLDGDLASNTLSWQWVAGTFSHKRYLANQDNINKYSRGVQRQTWLDESYETIGSADIPAVLASRTDSAYDTEIPGVPIRPLTGTVALRSIWQLDPRWQSDIEQHIVFIDAEWLSQWPMSPIRKKFIQHWAVECNAGIYHGTVAELNTALSVADVVREEYPACDQWSGQVIQRRWLYPMPDKAFGSFSQYFKQVKKSVGL